MKRLLSILLSLAVTLSCITVPAFAENGITTLDEEKIALINELGLVDIPSDDGAYGENVTRAEFVLYAGRILDIDESYKSANRYYKDLPSDHWAAGVINAMTEQGIIRGSDGLFRPDDNITMVEASSILLGALGYDEFVELKGGRPAGCSALASELDYYDGIKNADAMTLLDVYRLMYNAMMAPVLEYDISSLVNTSVKLNKDKTILGEMFDIYRVTGRLQSAFGMSINPTEAVSGNAIRVDGTEYMCDDIRAVDYLGCRVNAYYRKYDNDRTVFMVFPKNTGDILEIDIKDFESYDSDTHTVKYSSGNSIKSQRIAVSATVLKNGSDSTSDVRGAFSDLEQGTIRLIKSDGGSEYNTVIIKNYSDIVVMSNDLNKKEIFDKIYSGNVLKLDEVKYLRIFDSTGNAVPYENIVEDNILSVCGSDEYCEIIVSAQTNTGKVDTLDTSSDEPSVTIDGETYTLGKSFIENNRFLLRVGYNVKYYINIFGNCVYAETAGTDNRLAGYIINSGVDYDTVVLKLLTQAGTVERIECAKKVSVNGKSYGSASVIMSKIAEDNNGGVNMQLILYSLDENNKIKRIDTAAPFGAERSGGDVLWQDTTLKSQATFYTTNLMMGESIKMTNDTICFVVPPTVRTERDYTVMSPSDFINEEEYDATAYKTDDSTNTADIVVISSDSTAGTWFHQILLVDKIYEEYDAQTGDVKECASVWLNGTKTKYPAASNLSFSANGIKSGDVLRVDLNSRGEITATHRAFDYENRRPNGLNSTFWWEIYITYGYIKSVKDNVAKFEYTEEDGSLRTGVTTLTGVPIMVYDGNSKNKVTIGSISDVLYAMNHDELVFVGQKFGATTCIIIFK